MHFSSDNFKTSTGRVPIYCWYYLLCQWKQINNIMIILYYRIITITQLPHLTTTPWFNTFFNQFAIKSDMALYFARYTGESSWSDELAVAGSPCPNSHSFVTFITCLGLCVLFCSEILWSLSASTALSQFPSYPLLLFSVLSHWNRFLGEALVIEFWDAALFSFAKIINAMTVELKWLVE